MSRKLFAFTATALFAALPGMCWQSDAGQNWEITATARGSIVAWPAAMFDKSDVTAFAEQAESGLASSGRVAQPLVQELVIKTKSTPPRRPAPGGGRPHADAGIVVRSMVLRAGAAQCQNAPRSCYGDNGGSCREGQPGCRCVCAVPVNAEAEAIEAFRSKRNGVPLIVIAPSESDPASVTSQVLSSPAMQGYFIKVVLAAR
ncbi:MAG: hypothetical protein KatS3mg005_0401 [Bryobacteraceae bacterium]|nr:MAG: hypothetical protein KatS3mg005_0401 [Bryobacteraceae bacterium]